eukprot:6208989-Pleurochrysis_carterae.AAC.2
MRSARVVGAAERERAQAASDRHDACVKKAEALYKQGEVRQALRQFEAAFVEFGKTTTALRIADLYLQATLRSRNLLHYAFDCLHARPPALMQASSPTHLHAHCSD